MIKVLLFTILFTQLALANDSERAVETTKVALLATTTGQNAQKKVSDKLVATINIPKEYSVPIASVTVTIIKGKIDSKSLKYNYEVLGGTLRPDASYNLKTEEINSIITLNWSF